MNSLPLPQGVVNALITDRYPHGSVGLSVTTLIDSPRVRILNEQHRGEITQTPVDRVWAAFGTAMHTMLESTGGTGLVEERLYATVDGHLVSGAIDLQDGNSLYDHKVTSTWTVLVGDRAKWEAQLNLLDWLRFQSKGLRADTLANVILFRDWSHRKVGEAGYPTEPIMALPVTQWSVEEQEEYMRKQVDAHTSASTKYAQSKTLPACTDQDRWHRPGKFAVLKRGNKRASRLCETRAEAATYIAAQQHGDFEIQERPGEDVRCAGNFCRVAPWCDQYRAARDGWI